MKTVLLMRHGKSDWDADYRDDSDRPLAPRGIRASRTMGRVLSGLAHVPDKIISSPAVRANGTAELAALAGGWAAPISSDSRLYEESIDAAMDVLRELDDDLRRGMLVGHQPDLSLLAELLIGGGSLVFPTAAVCRIDCRCDRWRDLEPGTGELRWLLPPRMFDKLGIEI
ncbi:hypothetical protein ABI59_10810 [Acidobacteria bacterium Mor1]|nr:hypothetical protein ABI59_10810 [Acidobacteria bacterium Mor1]